MNVNNISKGTKEFIFSSLDNLANNDFKSSLIRPFVKTAIENNFYKVENFLNTIAEKDGNINIEKLIDDIINSVLNGKKGSLDLNPIGELEVGDGGVKIIIPSFNTFYKFTSEDFIELKNKLISKYGSKNLY